MSRNNVPGPTSRQSNPYSTQFNQLSQNNPARRSNPVPTRTLSVDETHAIDEVFHLFDSDGDNHLGLFQLRYAVKALGFNFTKDAVMNMIRDYGSGPEGEEVISLDQFRQLMEYNFTTRDPEEELRAAFQLFDTESSGLITLESLKKIALDLGEQVSEDELRSMIEEFDYDNDQAINFLEFKRIMNSSTSS